MGDDVTLEGLVCHQIVGGPSKEELFEALRLRIEEETALFKIRLESESQLTPAGEFHLMVESISLLDDGKGSNWALKLLEPSGKLGSQYLEAQFDTNTSEGWLRPIR
ncbi:MAG: hypothetical protein G01um101449_228 [Parcubacteria group bacterium Gr01-1014_49]|nr:MAG: hypothetical protein G01um101449_228 [Parcubacteria group bacterium Gr01-1014_49]